MNNNLFPKTWQEFMSNSGYMPVVINSIERHFDADWSQSESHHQYYEMVYAKKGISVFDIEGIKTTIGPNDILISKPQKGHTLKVQETTPVNSLFCIQFYCAAAEERPIIPLKFPLRISSIFLQGLIPDPF